MPSLGIIASGSTGGPWIRPSPVAKLAVDTINGRLQRAAAAVDANLHGQAPEPLR